MNRMKISSFFIAIFICFSIVANGQNDDNFKLSVSPTIDLSISNNKLIVNFLNEFLKTKNKSLTENKYWLKSDFEKYSFPYQHIFNIEQSKFGQNFYKPTLMQIIDTENDNVKIVKVAFIGHNPENVENQIKSIYNLVANINNEKIIFSSYLDFATAKWQKIQTGSLTYYISPRKIANQDEIVRQTLDLDKICKWFGCQPIPITYYSCVDPKEIFEIKGFDYNPMMYVDKSGGMAETGGRIFSGNSSEIYTHEIVHIYTNKLFPSIDKFIDEGLATYIAGSGKYDYNWHRNKLKQFINQQPDYDFTNHTDPYERLYFEKETSIPYLTAALILERANRIFGKEKLLNILRSDQDFWVILKDIGLTKENINSKLREELTRDVKSLW